MFTVINASANLVRYRFNTVTSLQPYIMGRGALHVHDPGGLDNHNKTRDVLSGRTGVFLGMWNIKLLADCTKTPITTATKPKA